MRLSRCFPPATRPPDPLAGVLSTPAHHHWRQPTPTRARPEPRYGPVERQEVPLAVSRARQTVQWQWQPQPVASTSKSTLDSPAIPRVHDDAVEDAEREFRDVLDALPATDQSVRVKHRNTADVRTDVALSRRACFAAYSALAKLRQVKAHAVSPNRNNPTNDSGKGKGPLRNEKWIPLDLERKVARLVGETMRLLLRLGHVHAATDLDRAFFTSRNQSRSERRRRAAAPRGGDAGGEKRGRDQATKDCRDDRDGGRLGDGLGLRRSAHQLAWMQAVSAGLELQELDGHGRASASPGQVTGAGRRFLENLEGLLVEGRDAVPSSGSTSAPLVRADKLAFAARQMGRVQRSIRSATPPSSRPGPLPAFQAELATWVAAIRRAECEDADELVSIALLESGLERLEQAAARRRSHSGRDCTEVALLHKVEEDINRLVRSLEQDGAGGASLARRREASRHAHILALAIRFLLFRQQHSSSTTLRAASSPSTDTLLPAAQLYAVLLKLPLPPVSTPALVADIRARQTSSLFRLLDAYLDAQAHSHPKGPRAFRSVERILDLLDLTLGRFEAYGRSHGAKSQREGIALGVSTKTYQRILRVLSEPSRLRRTSPTLSRSNPATDLSPPFAFLSRALDTIARARAHDGISRTGVAVSTSSGQAVFAHPKTTIHFVRAWFAAPLSASTPSPLALDISTGSSLDCRPREDGSEIQYRLRSLLAFVDAIDAVHTPGPASLAEDKDGPGAAAARRPSCATLRSRKVVVRAVREIVEQRWGTVGPHRRSRDAGERGEDVAECANDQIGGQPASWTEAVVEGTLERWLAPVEADSP
ncbi:hypothetical protein BMF94_3736 [Rhodotorula taiwanensis]|uniref:Uncharacterized protein n=1 Tax=Rhodotorula taiwanensis TaxID=741276 RepID=A0A2S5B9E9_9BASI|nr:hypothetical protein BMF94_3736 [Rhodotorula taiwanensis]